jgi:hypothetical protein
MREVQGALLSMDRDAEGVALLKRLSLDGFTEGSSSLFDGIRRMMAAVRGSSGAAQP